MEGLVKVKVNTNLSHKDERVWYVNQQGCEFMVKDKGEYFKLPYLRVFIPKSDCTVVDPVDHVQPEPKGWCIKRTPENADEINEWVNNQEGVQTRSYMNIDYIHSGKVNNEAIPYLEEFICEGFTELHTVEEFFSKVGYNATPKLIARVGEWIKIVSVDFSMSSHTLNKPYQLRSDLYEKGDFQTVLDDDGNTDNGYSPVPWSMKFEVCPAPVQRKSIGVYENTEIFHDTPAWDIDIMKLEIRPVGERVTIEGWNFSSPNFSKAYLSPKEANQRLKSEVEKKTLERKFTIEEIKPYFTGHYKVCSFEDYAIELVEKEFNIKYLEE
jgi:hypothetical protein